MSLPASRGAAPPFPAPLRGVLFDLDGVLVDSARAWHRVIERAGQRFGTPAVFWEKFRPTFGQGPEADQRDFFPGVSAEDVSRFYDEAFPGELDALEVMPGAPALLEALAARGLARAVVTNTPVDLAREVLSRTGLLPLLDAFAGAGEAPEKPAPDLIWLALGRVGLAPPDALYVGDSSSDRAAAAAAGIFMVGFRREGDGRVEGHDGLLPLIDS